MIWRWLKRLLVALAVLVVLLLTPVAYTELACRGAAAAPTYTAILPAEHHRPEARTFLTYPEWHIVHAYDDYAQVIETGDPHEFAYIRAILGFWSSLCPLATRAASHGGFDRDTKLMVYTIGVSFTAEFLAKAAYEKTLGRLATALRGPDRTALDDLSADQARDYADYLRQVPWHQWDFRADRTALALAASDALRDRERRAALGLELSVKAAYAGVIARAVENLGPDELTLRMIATGVDPAAHAGVSLIATRPEGLELETPRYRTLTHILIDMAKAGGEFTEIAGNDDILLSALGEGSAEGAIFSARRQGYADRRHLILLKVTDLADFLRTTDLQVEHIHDY